MVIRNENDPWNITLKGEVNCKMTPKGDFSKERWNDETSTFMYDDVQL